jgi:hypothetical protein
VIFQEFQLQKQQGFYRRPALLAAINRRYQVATARKVDGLQDASQVMIGGDGGGKNALIKVSGRRVLFWS